MTNPIKSTDVICPKCGDIALVRPVPWMMFDQGMCYSCGYVFDVDRIQLQVEEKPLSIVEKDEKED